MSAAALTYKGLFEAQQPVILNGITPARDCIWGQYSLGIVPEFLSLRDIQLRFC